MIEASLVGPGLVAESTELVPDWRKADLVGMREAIGNINCKWTPFTGCWTGK